MPAGHPTDYKGEETIKLARKYIASCKDKGKEVNLPTAAGLALALNVAKRTIYNWADEYPEFLHILDELNKSQENKLINNGLSGKYNANIAKLVLGKHGYKEQMGLSGENEGEPIKIQDVSATLDKIYGKSDQTSE